MMKIFTKVVETRRLDLRDIFVVNCTSDINEEIVGEWGSRIIEASS